MSWYLLVLKKYAEFSGRARRKEYWYFVLFNIIVAVALLAIDVTVGTFSATAGLGLLSGIYSIGVIIPSIAVGVRRLHDTSRSGWWILIGFIPLVGGLILIVLMALPGTPGENQYGSNPIE